VKMAGKTNWHKPPLWLRIYIEALFWLKGLRATNETRDWQWVRLYDEIESDELIIPGEKDRDLILGLAERVPFGNKLFRHELLRGPTSCRLQSCKEHLYMLFSPEFIDAAQKLLEETDDCTQYYTQYPAFYVSEPVSYSSYVPDLKRVYWAPAAGEAKRVDEFETDDNLELVASITRVQRHNWAEHCLSGLVVRKGQRQIASVVLALPLPDVCFDAREVYCPRPVPRVTQNFQMEASIVE